jgi:S-adenosylmethionine decarboxylase
MQTKGQHVIADIWLNEYPASGKELAGFVVEALGFSGMTVVGEKLHYFDELALTGVWLLSESHFSLHTFPERNFLSVDCYTCGNEGQPMEAVNKFMGALDIQRAHLQVLERG